MPKIVELPDGREAEFPDDMDNAAIGAALSKQFPPSAADNRTALNAVEHSQAMKAGQYAPSSPTTAGGRQMQEFVGGAKHALDRAAMGVKGLMPGVELTPDDRALLEQGEAFVQTTGPASTVGQIAGDVGMSMGPIGAVNRAMMLPKAAALMGRAAPAATAAADIAANAGYSYATAPEDRGSAAAWGGAGAAGGRVLSKALSTIARPAGELGPNAKTLIEHDIQPTFGQVVRENQGIAGKMMGRLEDSMTSIPLAGSMITRRRQEAADAFRAATRQAALPPGAPAEAAESVNALAKSFNEAYERTLGGLEFPTTPEFRPGSVIDKAAMELPVTDGQIAQAKRYVADVFKSQLGADTPQEAFANPAAAHRIESMIKGKAANYKSSADASQRDFGQLLHETANQWRDTWRNALPDGGKQAIGALDAQYRQFVPVRRAAKTGNLTDPDNYSPQVLLRAIRAGDRGPNKGTFLAGNAPQQKLASAAADVLPSRVNDSGTAERAMVGVLAGGGASALGFTPQAVGALLVAMGYSTAFAQKYLTGQLAPAAQKVISDQLRQAMPLAAQAGRAGATQSQQGQR